MSSKSLLVAEIRQSRPFRSLAQEGLVALLRTADVVRRRAAALVEPRGITLQQYNVLRILRGAEHPLPTLDIAERMVEQAPGITRLIDRLESKGLVERRSCDVDRRRVFVGIAAAGLTLLAELDDEIDAFDDRALGTLTAPEIETLLQYLDAVRQPPA